MCSIRKRVQTPNKLLPSEFPQSAVLTTGVRKNKIPCSEIITYLHVSGCFPTAPGMVSPAWSFFLHLGTCGTDCAWAGCHSHHSAKTQSTNPNHCHGLILSSLTIRLTTEAVLLLFASTPNINISTDPEGRVFKESAEQLFPLSVFLVQALPYFCQPLRSLSSHFSRRCAAATTAVAENLTAAVVNNVSLYVETM